MRATEAIDVMRAVARIFATLVSTAQSESRSSVLGQALVLPIPRMIGERRGI